MPKFIPEAIIDQIQQRCDIAQIISGYIQLKRAGRNFKALCPFHQEKTPSFMVNPAKQIYHCFGCGIGGDVFSFIMKYENLDFREAIKLLADKVGVIIPEYEQMTKEDITLIALIYKAQELAATFYQDILLNQNIGKKALEYLKSRGINEKTTEAFKIGFAPNAWDGFLKYAQENNLKPSILLEAGLISEREDKQGFYDRFRNRIMFPIFDIKGRIVGFGGRILPEAGIREDESLPKYINSPETAIYYKGKLLYGLNFNKNFIREKNRAIIVEGYMDFLTPYQAGVNEIVASCGTSLTVEQIRLLKRFTTNVIMVYDADLAGQDATLRNLDLFIEEEMQVKIVRLPKGFDPDSFVRQRGVDEFKRSIDGATDFFDYKLRLLIERHGTAKIEDKLVAINGMLPTIAKVQNAILRSGYLKRLSEELSVDEAALRTEFKRLKDSFNVAYTPNPLKKLESKGTSAEKLFLSLIMEDCTLIERAKDELTYEYFQDPLLKKIMQAIYELHKIDKDISPTRLINYLHDEDASRTIAEVVSLMEEVVDKERCLEDCIRRLKKDDLKNKLDTLQKAIKDAEILGDHLKIKSLIAQYNSLIKSMKE